MGVTIWFPVQRAALFFNVKSSYFTTNILSPPPSSSSSLSLWQSFFFFFNRKRLFSGKQPDCEDHFCGCWHGCLFSEDHLKPGRMCDALIGWNRWNDWHSGPRLRVTYTAVRALSIKQFIMNITRESNQTKQKRNMIMIVSEHDVTVCFRDSVYKYDCLSPSSCEPASVCLLPHLLRVSRGSTAGRK